jgi:hypothetical protein
MSVETLIGFGGIVIGSTISLLSIYLNQHLTDESEKRKEQISREKEAITQVFSPLVFVLDGTREVFATLLVAKNTLDNSLEIDENGKLLIINLLKSQKSKLETHPRILKELLIGKSGLMEPTFYGDLFYFWSYLDAIIGFVDVLVTKALSNSQRLQEYINSFIPIIREVDTANERIRVYALQKVTRQKVEYNVFFIKEKTAEIEGFINKTNQLLTGVDIPDWDNLLGKHRKR